jgi:AIR synthase-related protein
MSGMSGDLASLAAELRAARGLAHKSDIAPVLARLRPGASATVRNGDDCAAIPDGDGFLLFAIEGFLPEFVADDPRFAGWCGVMVNVSDVYAMGGRPIAVVDAVFGASDAAAAPILDGLAAGARTYGVPVVGGHTNTRAGQGGLSVAVLGRAQRLLTSFDARPGEALIAAIDLRGAYREPHPFWDASTGAEPARLRGDLEVLPGLAEAGLCRAGKDISMAGLVGTALMLLECSGAGARIDIDAIPRPEGVALARWLQSFPSYGFLLTASEADVPAVLARFAARGIASAAIGRIDATRTLRIARGAAEAEVWRLDAPLIGAAA